MDSKTERLSLYFNAVAEIVDSHGISIEIYKYIRNQMTDFFRRVESKTDDVELLISGSSYDNLHMTRLIKSESGEQAFLPQTDFDYMIIHKKMPVLLATDKEAYLKARGYFGTPASIETSRLCENFRIR